jgi:hypothetical protein
MALIQRSETSYSKILTIVQGYFTQRLSEEEVQELIEDQNTGQLRTPEGELVTSRVLEKGPNAGLTKYEIRAQELSPSAVIGAEFQQSNYGNNLILKLLDDDENAFNLQIPTESGFFAQFAKRIPNIDFDKQVTFKLAKSKLDDKPYLFISQGGEPIKFAFTKDNPNGCPPPVQKNIKGKTVWVWEDHENFLYELVVKFVNDLSDNDMEETDVPF